MVIETGDMWQIFNRTSLFCITTNATIRGDGRLVMGRGIALQAKNKLPDIGYGHLSEAEVLPIILELPDSVHVWRFE